MDSDREIEIGHIVDFKKMELGETVRMGQWHVTLVPNGWIYTLKNSSAALGHSVQDYHSVFVPGSTDDL